MTVVCVLALQLGFLLSPGGSASAAVPCPTVIAHRGNAFYGSPVENSLGAFTTAFALGARWVETDVQFTSDNVPVLMHDTTVDRTTTGTGPLAGMTAQQFTALTMNDGQHPPTLAQALDLVRAYPDRHIMMEAKEIIASQEQMLLDLLAGLEEQVYVNGFANRLANIQRLKAANPELHVSLATNSPVLPAPDGMSGEDVEYTHVTADDVAQLHAAGLHVQVWVPNSQTAWRSLRDIGVDAIMTNNVSTYLQWAATECSGEPGPTDQTAPSAPTGLTRTISGFTVRLTWNPSTDDVGVTGYTVLRGGVAVGTTTTETTYTDSTALPGKTYTYTVRARDAANNQSAPSAGVSATLPVDRIVPTSPTGLKATVGAAGTRRITLTWNAATDNAGVTGYYLFRGNSKYRQLGNVLTFADTGLTAGTKYIYKVYALDASGNWSAPTANVSATAR